MQYDGTAKPRVVVITGASAGVGRATAQAFAREGARIGLLARGVAGLEAATLDVEQLVAAQRRAGRIDSIGPEALHPGAERSAGNPNATIS